MLVEYRAVCAQMHEWSLLAPALSVTTVLWGPHILNRVLMAPIATSLELTAAHPALLVTTALRELLITLRMNALRVITVPRVRSLIFNFRVPLGITIRVPDLPMSPTAFHASLAGSVLKKASVVLRASAPQGGTASKDPLHRSPLTSWKEVCVPPEHTVPEEVFFQHHVTQASTAIPPGEMKSLDLAVSGITAPMALTQPNPQMESWEMSALKGITVQNSPHPLWHALLVPTSTPSATTISHTAVRV